MKKKHLVVQGATCMCNFGSAPDKLKVLTNQKEYANDPEGKDKLIASDLDIGVPFEKGTFGNCSQKNGNPCVAAVTQWSGYYEKTTLYTGGKILIETSKATCPTGGPDCIRIINHGQQADVNKLNLQQAKPEVHAVLNPAVDIEKMLDDGVEAY